jgi:hypothetical protein
MNAVRGNPGNRTTFEGERSANGEGVIEPGRNFERAVRVQTVVTQANAQPGSGPIQRHSNEEKLPGKEEKSRDGADMETRHSDGCRPIQAL